MSSKVNYKCDVCGHAISGNHQKLYMSIVTVHWTETINDGGISTEGRVDTYHVHNDFSNHCLGKLWDVLEKDRK